MVNTKCLPIWVFADWKARETRSRSIVDVILSENRGTKKCYGILLTDVKVLRWMCRIGSNNHGVVIRECLPIWVIADQDHIKRSSGILQDTLSSKIAKTDRTSVYFLSQTCDICWDLYLPIFLFSDSKQDTRSSSKSNIILSKNVQKVLERQKLFPRKSEWYFVRPFVWSAKRTFTVESFYSLHIVKMKDHDINSNHHHINDS